MTQGFAIRLAGTGGQGILLAGMILAEAAVLHDNKHAIQVQAYGPQVRGGSSRAEIIIGDEPIDYPLIETADLVLALSQQACDAFTSDLASDGMLLIDSDLVRRTPSCRVVSLPITALAQESTGTPITANMLALGLIAGLTSVISRPALMAAIESRAPKGTAEANLTAMAAGYDLAEPYCEDGRRVEIVEALIQLAERGSVAAVARLRGIREQRVQAWVRAAAQQWRSFESILTGDYHLSRAQIKRLWRLVMRRTKPGSTIA
jgi:2-oxoglutarate ferredoxin oxidoreductase subunit gamma